MVSLESRDAYQRAYDCLYDAIDIIPKWPAKEITVVPI